MMVSLWRNWGRRLAWVAMALAVPALLSVGRSPAQVVSNPPYVVRVEEDWTLVVNQTNDLVASPQVSTQMARWPGAQRFFNFHLNSVDLPAFALGGLQLQVWRGTDNLAVYTHSNASIMATPDELVTWTQYLRKDGSTLYFGISGASSQTWGDFSGIEVASTGNSSNLDDYDPSYSLQNSGVTFGANRVASFKLVAVRLYYSNGTVTTDSTERVVYAAPQQDGAANP
jgi:hypothetical protein